MGFQSSKSSGELTASAAAKNGECWISALEVITDGSNDATVILYDNGSAASGTVLIECKVVGVDNYGGRIWNFPVKCSSGIYASISGTGASCIVEYIDEEDR